MYLGPAIGHFLLLERVNPSLKANFRCTLTSGGQRAVSIFIALALSILALYIAGYLDDPSGHASTGSEWAEYTVVGYE